MKKFTIILIIMSIIVSCTNFSGDNDIVNKKTWVYLEIFYITKNDTTSNYIYGKIDQKDMSKIKSQKNSESLFELTEGRYLDNNDKVHTFENDKESGTFFFRIKDIVYLEIQKYDPLKINKDTIAD